MFVFVSLAFRICNLKIINHFKLKKKKKKVWDFIGLKNNIISLSQ